MWHRRRWPFTVNLVTRMLPDLTQLQNRATYKKKKKTHILKCTQNFSTRQWRCNETKAMEEYCCAITKAVWRSCCGWSGSGELEFGLQLNSPSTYVHSWPYGYSIATWAGLRKSVIRRNRLYVQVTVHRDKLRIKQPSRCIKYPKLYFVIKLYMFRASSVPIIRSYRLYTRQLVCFMQVMWPLPSRVRLERSLQVVPPVMSASVWESDCSHMDWGQENREAALTLPTPIPQHCGLRSIFTPYVTAPKQSQVGTLFEPARKRSHNLHETYQLQCLQ
jgi:hypothetical protein